MIICELMSKGDLHRHLHTIKIKGYIWSCSPLTRLNNYYYTISIYTLSILNQQEVGAMLLSYSRQVASAMVYLSVKGYIHRDLAARNILLSVDGVCKVFYDICLFM